MKLNTEPYPSSTVIRRRPIKESLKGKTEQLNKSVFLQPTQVMVMRGGGGGGRNQPTLSSVCVSLRNYRASQRVIATRLFTHLCRITQGYAKKLCASVCMLLSPPGAPNSRPAAKLVSFLVPSPTINRETRTKSNHSSMPLPTRTVTRHKRRIHRMRFVVR